MDIDPPVRRCAEGCTIISMDENAGVNKTIRTFERNELCENCPRKGGNQDLDEVIALIANRAQGM
jgi:hypothetical protein